MSPRAGGSPSSSEGVTRDPDGPTTLFELVRAGRSPESLAKEFDPSAQSIRSWVTKAERDGGHEGRVSSASPSMPTFCALHPSNEYDHANPTEGQIVPDGASALPVTAGT
jgi:hypothetical protein